MGVTEVATPETPGTRVYGNPEPVEPPLLAQRVEAIDKAVEEADADDETAVEDSPEDRWLAAEKAWIDSFTWFDPTKDWAHTWIEFRGDRLAVRVPKQAQLSVYQIATSEGASAGQRAMYTRQLIESNMSPATYRRVMDRLMDPDDEDYDDETFGEVMTKIVELRTGPAPQPNRAQRRHPTT